MSDPRHGPSDDELLAPFVARGAAREGLGADLRALHAAGRAAWPTIDLSPLALAEHLAALCNDSDGAPRDLGERNARDLYLACAAARGDVEAVAALEREHLGGVVALLRRGGEDQTVAEEAAQRLRVKLLVGPESRDGGDDGPRLRGYGGRGALAAFLRVAATREAVNLHRQAAQRRERPTEPAAQGRLEARAAQALSADDPELRVLRERHRAAFEDALGAALQALDPAERNLLRLVAVEGLRGEQVAALFGVTRSTIVRRLTAARRAVFDGTRERLRQQVHPEEFESLARALQSQLDVSVARLLK